MCILEADFPILPNYSVFMILLAESGSTKTDWRWIDAQGNIQQTRTEGINPFYEDAISIQNLIETHVKALIQSPIREIYYYGTGIVGDATKEAMKQIFDSLFSPTVCEVESDVIGAGRALFGDGSGIACILGTGANSCFFDAQKVAFQIPPLGFWLGDEGSGGYLGKSLVLSYLHNELPLNIREAFEGQFGKFDRIRVLEHAYRKPFPNRYFASFAPFLFEYRKDPFVYQLISDAFDLFFQKYVLKYPMLRESPIGFVGSVAYHFQDILRHVGEKHQVSIQQVIESPAARLLLYHQPK